MAKHSKIWGYALEAPRRPSMKKQLDTLASFGLATHEQGPIWKDSLRKVKRGRKTLEGRTDLLKHSEAGDKILVVNAECLGVSADDAESFVKAVQEKGVTLIVSERVFTVEPDGDAKDLLAEVKRLHNRTYQRRWRAKKQKSQS
jgi:DNA invertase Pin-like site-specific DNA recombinase